MFSARKPENRRSERTEELEVKLRSEPLRAGRRRLAVALVGIGLTLLAVAYSGALGWSWLRSRIIFDNQAFALNTIEVETDGWVPADMVRYWADLRLGENLLTLDLARIRRDLELIPQIESVSVERILPHLLRVKVTEREPVAQVQGLRSLGDGGLSAVVYFLDRAGVVIPPLLNPGLPQAISQKLESSLPTIRGVCSAELRPGQPISLPAVRAAIDMLAEFDKSSMAGQVDLRLVDVAAPEVLEVTTGQGAQVTFAPENLAAQFRRWRLVHDAGLHLGKVVASLDLSISNNCPVLWLEANAQPPVRIPPPRTFRTYRRHV